MIFLQEFSLISHKSLMKQFFFEKHGSMNTLFEFLTKFSVRLLLPSVVKSGRGGLIIVLKGSPYYCIRLICEHRKKFVSMSIRKVLATLIPFRGSLEVHRRALKNNSKLHKKFNEMSRAEQTYWHLLLDIYISFDLMYS